MRRKPVESAKSRDAESRIPTSVLDSSKTGFTWQQLLGWAPKPWAIYFTVAMLTALCLFPFVRALSRIGDEGIIVDGAHRVLHGQIPGRDFFEPMGPGSFYWLAAFFRIFGESIETARYLVLLTGLALTVLVLYCVRHISARPALPVLFTTLFGIPMWPATSHHWDGNLFALSAFAMFLAWHSSRRPAALVAAGVFAGVCCCTFQSKGILMCVAFVATVCILERRHSLRSIAILLISFALVPVAVGCLYASQGALGDLVYVDFLWPAAHYSKVNRVPYGFGFAGYFWTPWYTGLKSVLSFPAAFLATVAITAPFLVVIALPGLLAAAVAVLRRKAFPRELAPFWICGAALWLSEMHRPDIWHLFFGCSIWVILLCALLGKLRFSYVPACLLAISLILAGSVPIARALQATTRIQTRRGVLYGLRAERALNFLIAHTTPGEPSFVYSYCPLYYFLSGTENPTRFSAFVYGFNTPDQFHSAVESIESKRVRYVLWDTIITDKTAVRWFPAYIQPSPRDLVIENYLLSHYHQVGLEDDFRVLKRND